MNVTKGGKLRLRLKRDIPLYGMLLPGALFFIIFKYVPMYGIVMAFQNFRMARGFLRSEWVGLLNFQKVFESAFFPLVLKNTIVISLYKIIVGFPAPILLALMLNEIRCRPYKKLMQTIVYMPHFISWIVVASLVNTFFSSSSGVFAQITGQKIDCLINPDKFRGVLDDGRPYLVFNESVAGAPRDRGRLLLGVGKKGGFSLCKLYIVDEGSLLESQNRRLALSYPYARQIGEKLYLGYSYESQPGNGGNNNDAMLAVVTAREL